MPNRPRLLGGAVAALLGAACLVFAGLASASTPAKLTGNVGIQDAFKITLSDATKKPVKTLKAGSYTFTIHDGSTLHSFALDGPNGFAKDFTTVPFKGTKTVTLKLKKGSYKYYCAAHESTMFGHFTVT
jgi:plastocyanin